MLVSAGVTLSFLPTTRTRLTHLIVLFEHLRNGLRGLALLAEPQEHRLAVLEDVERRLGAAARKATASNQPIK